MTSKKRDRGRTDEIDRGVLRSPPYPCLTLEKAVTRAFSLSRAVGSKEASPAAVARAWGNASAAGKVLSYITALREYGLTAEKGRGETKRIQLSELGMALVRQQPPRELLTKAALNPPPFRELWRSVRTGSSADEKEVLRVLCAERERKGLMAFTERGAQEAFRIFRINVEYVGLHEDDDPLADPSEASPARTAHDRQNGADSEPGSDRRTASAPEYLEFRVPLNSGRDAKFIYPKNPSQEELEQLKVMLQGVQVIVEGLLKS